MPHQSCQCNHYISRSFSSSPTTAHKYVDETKHDSDSEIESYSPYQEKSEEEKEVSLSANSIKINPNHVYNSNVFAKYISKVKIKIKNLLYKNNSYSLCSKYHKNNCIYHAACGYFKTFAMSFLCKTFLLLFQNILSRKMKISKLGSIFLNKDTLKFAQFLSLMSTSYKIIICILRRLFNKNDIKFKTIAGFISAFWIILENPSRQKWYAINFIFRSISDGIRLSVYHNKLPIIKHFGVSIFILCQLILLNAVFYVPKVVKTSFYKFVLKVSNMKESQIAVLRNGVLNNLKNKKTQFVACCPSIHKNKSCTMYNIKTFINGFINVSPIYILIHFIPLLLFKRKQTFSNPKYHLNKSFKNTLISCLFVSTYAFCVKGNVCLVRNILQKDCWWNGILCGICGGLTLLIENEKRRPELILHCLPISLQILFRMFTINKYPIIYNFLRSKALRVITFQISIAIWITIRSISKGVEQSNKVNMTVLNLIFGSHN